MIRILLVDDHADVREGLTLMLQLQADMTIVAEAADGESALPLAEATKPDVALVDMQLPGIDGYEVIKELAVRVPGCVAIMVSLYDSEHSQRRALEAGAYAFVSKSRVGPTLVATVRAAAKREGSGV